MVCTNTMGYISVDNLFKTLDNCPFCGTGIPSGLEPFDEHVGDPYLIRIDPSYEMYRVKFYMCPECDLVFQNPVWTPEASTWFYEEKYRTHIPDKKELDARVESCLKLYDWIADTWKAPGNPKVLDIGCSIGSMVRLFQVMGARQGQPKWDSYGIEPTKDYAEHARHKMKAQVSTGLFDNNSWPGIQFSLVMANHVLEHIHDPLKFLINMRRKMKPGGRIFIGCPALDCPCGPQFKRVQFMDFNFFAVPHLYTFTTRTMTRFVNKAGLFIERLDHDQRGMLIIARYAKEGEVNELCGRDSPEQLRKVVNRARELERQYRALQQKKERDKGGDQEGSEVLDVPAQVA